MHIDAEHARAAATADRLRRAKVAAVILPSWVGDVVMAEPAIRALRNITTARLIALGRPGLAALLEGRRHFDDSIDHAMRGIAGPWSAARALRARGVEAVVVLPNSPRAALTAHLSGARLRMGLATQWRRWMLTDPVAPPPRRPPASTVAWYAALVERGLGVKMNSTLPTLAPTEAQRAAAALLLDGVKRPFAVLNPGANREDKRWPAESFIALGVALRRRGLSVVVTGAPAEAPLVATIASGAGGVDLVARGVTLGALVGLLPDAAVAISNDTGPRHIAIGCGSPTISLFGPTDPRWTLIEGARERRVVAEPFLPPEKVADDHPRACRIERIAVGDVLAAVESLGVQRR